VIASADTSSATNTPPPASPTPDSQATAEPVAPALHLILSATDDISLLTVKQVSNRHVLFNGELPKGQQVDLSPDGRVEITLTNAENLHIDQNGSLYALRVTGLQDFYWPTKKMENTPEGRGHCFAAMAKSPPASASVPAYDPVEAGFVDARGKLIEVAAFLDGRSGGAGRRTTGCGLYRRRWAGSRSRMRRRSAQGRCCGR